MSILPERNDMENVFLRGILGLFLLAALTGTVVFCAVCICAFKKRPVRKSDCLIVPGAKIRPDGAMSNSLRWRCEAALEAWKNGVAEKVIVCGGQGSAEPVAEAEAMEEWLAVFGVPRENIIAEPASADTLENFANAAQIMREHGWKTAAVVTSDYHVQRSLWIARDAGIAACGIAARSPHTPKGWLMARLRESCSWILYGYKRLF